MTSRKAKPKTIDEYLAGVKADYREALEKLRQTIRAVVPNAEECISYGIPAFRLNGRLLVGFGAWADHCSFYPMSSTTLRKFQRDMKNFQTSKGTPRRPVVGLVKSSSAPMTAAKPGTRRAAALRSRKVRTACPRARVTSSFTIRHLKPGDHSRRTNGTTALSIRGNSNVFGIWNHHLTIPITFTPAWKMLRCSNQQTAENRGTNSPGYAAAILVQNGSRARAGCVCTRFFSIRAIQSEFPSRSRPQVRFARMMAERLGNRSIAGCIRSTFPIRLQKLGIACIAWRCTRRDRTRYSCKKTGMAGGPR